MRRPSTETSVGLQFLCVRLGKLADQVPIRRRDKRHPLALAFDDQPHGHALHAAGRKLGSHLSPQQRRHFVAVQPVEDPARFLRSDQVVVDVARRLQRGLDGLFGDFVKHQPVDRHLRLEHFEQVPTDGLPFAVFVRRQIQVFGLFQQVLQELGLVCSCRAERCRSGEVVVDVDAQVRPGSPLNSAGIWAAPCGRSRTWPMLASTVNPLPKNLLIVRALAGDSTITNAWVGPPDADFVDFFLAITRVDLLVWVLCVVWRVCYFGLRHTDFSDCRIGPDTAFARVLFSGCGLTASRKFRIDGSRRGSLCVADA